MTPSKSIPDWLANFPERLRDLDPRKHTLIEASAGTGKTYAIERLVLRLLVENPTWRPEEILLLSFTDKTVVELRERIRKLLRAQMDDSDPKARIEGWSPENHSRIRELWLHADDLSVHTLHAFCQSAVRRDPVANGALIRAELAEDRAMADIALDGLLRGAWAADPQRRERLTDALGIGAGESWKRKLVSLALKWQPWRSDVLVPDHDPDTVERLEAEAGQAAQALPAAVAAVNEGHYSIADFRRDAILTKAGKPSAKGEETLRKHAYEKVFRFCESRAPDTPQALRFFSKDFTKSSKVVKYGWETEIPAGARTLPEWKSLAEVCTALRKLGENLEVARKLRKLGLLAEAAKDLRGALDHEKLRRGRISYDDMPRRLVEALRRSPALAPRLRSRYKACIVDEFQDTDPIQWEILDALCLRESPRTPDESEVAPVPGHHSPFVIHHTLSLFLVGDPKQAIYAFRGGDLRTYMRARARFQALASEGSAQGIALDANYRSRPALVNALNEVFAHADWFGPQPEIPADPAWHLPTATDRIAFTPVRAGRIEEKNATAVVLRDLSSVPSNGDGKPVWPRKRDLERDVRGWIVARILEGIRGGRELPGDFAVLSRGNAEAEAIARLLRRRGIPCRIRRKRGPFHGPAADALRLLLEWIEDAANPDAQARILLLPFARRGAGDMPKGRPDRCPPLIARWSALARAGRWPEFLGSVASGGGYRERLEAASTSEAARFDRLIRILAEAGSTPGLSARALCDRFDAMRRGEENIDGDETDEAATTPGGFVTVMTLHLSKGLEFRHVFVTATGDGRGDDFLVLRDEDRTGFRIALDTQDAAHRPQAEAEAHEENKRLYYVAFTRAKETLFVPVLPEKLSKGNSGPLGGFAANALRALAGNPKTISTVRFDDADYPDAGLVADRAPQGEAPRSNVRDRETLLAETRKAFERRRRLTSYSRLALRAGEASDDAKAADPLLGEDGARIQRQEALNEVPEIEDAPTPEGISAEELPPGSEAGTALHALLERTRFATALETADPEAWLETSGHRALVEEVLQRESIGPAHASAAARAVWNALRCPIPVPGDDAAPSFRLADIPPADLRHEVEFLLPFPSGMASIPVANSGKPPEDIAWRSGGGTSTAFLWGFIDLVFRREGRYHLLDWKSNLLSSYDAASVRRSMAEHRYDLQWKLYAVALDRWLGARLPDYDPAKHFGGVCYLYLRGATPERFSGFTYRPTREELREIYPREIATLLGKHAESPR